MALAGAAAREPGLGRPLVATERAVFTTSRLSPLNLVVLVRLDGPAIDDQLPLALAALRERHPLLRARIVGPPGRPRFDVGDAAGPGSVPFRTERADGAWHALAVAEAELNTPFDPAVGPLARLTCLTGPGPATDLILTLHHAIADGASAANLVHELLDSCQARLTGQGTPTPAPASSAAPPPVTDLLPASMQGWRGPRRRLALVARECRDEVAYRTASRGQRRPVPGPGRAVLRPLALDAGTTDELVSRSRRQRLTLTSVLAAALLWQVNTELYQGRPATMRAVIWVDLRSYLNPPVGSEILGCYISMLRFPVRVDPGRGFTALVTDVQDLIERASRRGDRLPAAQLSPAMTRVAVRWPVARLGTVALSYGAAPSIRPSYGPVSVRDVRAFVSNNRIGAELAAVAGVSQGRLWCDLLYVDSDYGEATAASMAHRLLASLRDFSQQA